MEPASTLVVDAQPLQRLKGGMAWGMVAIALVVVGVVIGVTAAMLVKPQPTLPAPTFSPTVNSVDSTPLVALLPDLRASFSIATKCRHRNGGIATTTSLSVARLVSSPHPPPSPDGNPKVPPITRLPHRFALATLYFATGGDSNAWINNANWLNSNVHECDWHGWNCTMQWLLLGGNGMRGTLSREITLLPLFGLDLMTNQLTGSLPTELGQLSTLEGLRLNDNQFSAIIPTELGHLTSSLLYLTLSSGCHTYLPWPDDEAPNVAPWSESTSKGTLSIGID